jgi:hypothetical protein
MLFRHSVRHSAILPFGRHSAILPQYHNIKSSIYYEHDNLTKQHCNLVDIMNLHADPRALQRAQNAETQRMRRANRVSLEEENNHRRARRVIPGVREHESAQ